MIVLHAPIGWLDVLVTDMRSPSSSAAIEIGPAISEGLAESIGTAIAAWAQLDIIEYLAMDRGSSKICAAGPPIATSCARHSERRR